MNTDHIYQDLTHKCEDGGISPESPFFRLPSWPPPDDWPVSVDSRGEVISIFSDQRWILEPGRYWVVDFANGSYHCTNATGEIIRVKQAVDSENQRLLRLCISWWLWGDRRRISARSLRGYVGRIRPLFVLCAKEGISAENLNRHPRVMEKLVDFLAPSTANEVLVMLHELWSVREMIGFTLLTEHDLEKLAAMLPKHETQQTPYIPPRIWLYQIERLHAFLSDFLNHKNEIIEFYRYILNAYIFNFGSPEEFFSAQKYRRGPRGPFNAESQNIRGCKYLGTFIEVADSFGVADLLRRWRKERKRNDVAMFGGYLAMASFVANKYIINFSGMRIEESKSLRADCLKIERDPMFGEIYMLCGETTKTITDDDARWITSPSVKIAVDVMSTIAMLIIETRSANPFTQLSLEESSNPHLLQSAYHPWHPGRNWKLKSDRSHLNIRINYGEWAERNTSLFDSKQLQITEEDIRVARLVTPTIDPKIYALGNVWQFSDHQLRRTTAVNMLASDLVHDSSVQYELKHLKRAQSLYYGQGFNHVRLNQKYSAEYLRTAYEMLRKRIAQLANDRYISPHGEQHKVNLLSRVNPIIFERPIDKRDVLATRKLVDRGDITWKQTFLGVCGNAEPCAYGGITNILHCGPCGNGLLDRERLPELMDFRRNLKERLSDAEQGSPDYISLQLQLQALEGHINVLQK